MSQKQKLITGGTLVTADNTLRADVHIIGERIAQVSPNLGAELESNTDIELVDARGMYILPGGVDPHTHFDLPMFDTVSSDDHYTGHKAAAFGGTTTVMDFIPQDHLDLVKNLEAWQEKAAKAAIDYGFHMNITQFNGEVARQIPRLMDWGISTVKVFMAYNGRLRLHDGEIFQVMQLARDHGFLTMLHAENGDVIDLLVAQALARGEWSPIHHARTRPAWSAVDATLRGAALAAQAGAPLYIVHMNAGGEVDMLAYAREHGAPVMGETCPQYLFFKEAHLARPDGAKWVCSPPMRTKADQERIWKGLADGTFQVIGTDHCPFFYDGRKPIVYEGTPVAIAGKELGAHDFTKIPNGLPAVGDRLPVLWTYGVGAGRLTMNQFVALTSTQPARIFGLYPRKGCLQPGSDADIVIWDPDHRLVYGASIAQHRTDYNLFEGWELAGYPRQVYLRGELIVDQGVWHGKAGGGCFLKRGSGEVF